MNGKELRQKILLTLYAGIALGLTYSPGRQRRIIKEFSREWKNIKGKSLSQEIRNLYRSKLVETHRHKDGSCTLVLTDKGKVRALTYSFQNMKISKGRWDGKWRAVIFDIPEKIKTARNTLREKLKELGFCEFQKSVFVFPFECKDEIEFLVEFFQIKKYVRYGIFEFVDNDLHLRSIFKLL